MVVAPIMPAGRRSSVMNSSGVAGGTPCPGTQPALAPNAPYIRHWGMEKLWQSSDIVGFIRSFAEGGIGEGTGGSTATSFCGGQPCPFWCICLWQQALGQGAPRLPYISPPTIRLGAALSVLLSWFWACRTWRWGQFVDRNLWAKYTPWSFAKTACSSAKARRG